MFAGKLNVPLLLEENSISLLEENDPVRFVDCIFGKWIYFVDFRKQ